MLPRLGFLLLLVLAAPAAMAATDREVPASNADIQLSFAPIVKRVAPAVVNVYASRTVRQDASPMYADPFFRQFFNGLFGQAPSQRVQQSLGSGVIISADGLIVTNFHVIAEADEVKISLADKREFPADIVLKDQRSDLAVLKIKGNPGPLPTIDFADSDQIEVGDLVLAIGDPFGIGETVTSGIISALARPGPNSDDQYFIQTDAPINPGNSGGALIDMQGRLVGINSWIVSSGGGSDGIGFAIPANLVKAFTAAASTGVAPKRPWLGAELQSLTPDLAASLSMSVPSGVLVASVQPDGPAAAANLKPDDLITSVDGASVDDVGGLDYQLAVKTLGTQVKLGVVRDGKVFSTVLALQAPPEIPARDKRVIGGDGGFAGLTVENLSPAVADELAYQGPTKGVIVADITDGSNAADAGLQRGDVILKVDNATIDTTAQFASAISNENRYYDLYVSRGDQRGHIRVPG